MNDSGFFWKATFDDDSTLIQFDGDDEISFGGVLDREKELKSFELIANAGDDEIYKVDLTNGEVIGPGVKYIVSGNNLELIYKRRSQVRQSIITKKRLSPRVRHILGLKSDTNTKEFEIFAGLGQVEKKIKIFDKDGKDTDISEIVKTKLNSK